MDQVGVHSVSQRRKTAAELMAELQGDPAYRRREIEAEQKHLLREKEYSGMLEPLVTKLHELGLQGASLHEIVPRSAPLPGDAVEVLLAGLVELHDARATEAVIRALGAARTPFDGRPLTVCYELTDDEALKWAILNTGALARPHAIEDWLSSIEDTPAGETLRALAAE